MSSFLSFLFVYRLFVAISDEIKTNGEKDKHHEDTEGIEICSFLNIAEDRSQHDTREDIFGDIHPLLPELFFHWCKIKYFI